MTEQTGEELQPEDVEIIISHGANRKCKECMQRYFVEDRLIQCHGMCRQRLPQSDFDKTSLDQLLPFKNYSRIRCKECLLKSPMKKKIYRCTACNQDLYF